MAAVTPASFPITNFGGGQWHAPNMLRREACWVSIGSASSANVWTCVCFRNTLVFPTSDQRHVRMHVYMHTQISNKCIHISS